MKEINNLGRLMSIDLTNSLDPAPFKDKLLFIKAKLILKKCGVGFIFLFDNNLF